MVQRLLTILRSNRGAQRLGAAGALLVVAIAIGLTLTFVFDDSVSGHPDCDGGGNDCKTSTPTDTGTPVDTETPTETPTDTATPTITNTPTSTPTVTVTPTFINKTALPVPPNQDKSIIGGGTGQDSIYCCINLYVPMFNSRAISGEAGIQQFMPSSGTVTSFFVHLNGPLDPGDSYYFVVRKNGIDTLVDCTVSAGGSVCWDRSSCAYFSALPTGKPDLISVRALGSGSPSSRLMSWTAIFTPNAERADCPGG